MKDALAYFPDDVLLLIELAATYEFELNDSVNAKKYYERVLKTDPKHHLALDALVALS